MARRGGARRPGEEGGGARRLGKEECAAFVGALNGAVLPVPCEHLLPRDAAGAAPRRPATAAPSWPRSSSPQIRPTVENWKSASPIDALPGPDDGGSSNAKLLEKDIRGGASSWCWVRREAVCSGRARRSNSDPDVTIEDVGGGGGDLVVQPAIRRRPVRPEHGVCPEGSPFAGVVRVTVAAPSDVDEYLFRTRHASGGGGVVSRLPYTNQFRFLDKAVIVVDAKSEVGADGHPKCILRILPVWLTCIVYYVVFAQTNTYVILQATQSDRHLGMFDDDDG
uniref:Uncharacterized protein n=1 Tax=Oryza sativa subsp. japonica TaxID=39947 RepID=Q2QUP0_ORYSJ|nr:hypothetical protein LOC_Os12g15600 [Oryza sativa Japonica Group]